MDYPYDVFPFATESTLPLDLSQQQYEHIIQHPAEHQLLDPYYQAQIQAHGHIDFAEYHQHTPFQEEFDEYPETMSRPRLTKEQVEVLESQFQIHPKPNSNTKRALAMQTNLTLPRVAVWSSSPKLDLLLIVRVELVSES